MQKVFCILNEFNKKVAVDTSEWEYIIYEFPDKTYSIDLKIDNIDCDDDHTYLAADIALTNLLGEEKYITLINDVKVIASGNGISGSAFEYLNEHLLTIAN